MDLLEPATLRRRLRAAWEGRISGCQLGKPVEALSMMRGHDALDGYLEDVDALPLRDYVPFRDDHIESPVVGFARSSCRGEMTRAAPDDDIHYTLIALLLLEEHGAALSTHDVARGWLRLLPASATFTAELAAYRALLASVPADAAIAMVPDELDLSPCSDNQFSDWIGAQIRADLYGWVCPGRPELAAELARRDAALSHRGEGIHGAMFVAALGAAIPASDTLDAAIDAATAQIPSQSEAARAVSLGRSLAGKPDAIAQLREAYAELSPVHTLNNLALVVWGLASGRDDYACAIGDTVAAGWDTDCNGATVGGLWGLQGRPIPEAWTTPWQGRIGCALAGYSEFALDDVVERTARVAERLVEA